MELVSVWLTECISIIQTVLQAPYPQQQMQQFAGQYGGMYMYVQYRLHAAYKVPFIASISFAHNLIPIFNQGQRYLISVTVNNKILILSYVSTREG